MDQGSNQNVLVNKLCQSYSPIFAQSDSIPLEKCCMKPEMVIFQYGYIQMYSQFRNALIGQLIKFTVFKFPKLHISN